MPSPRFDPDWTISPGETLADWIEENGLTVRSTATACGRLTPRRVRGILDGSGKVTKDAAYRLEAGTGIPARLWLNLERAFRQGLADGKHWTPPSAAELARLERPRR